LIIHLSRNIDCQRRVAIHSEALTRANKLICEERLGLGK